MFIRIGFSVIFAVLITVLVLFGLKCLKSHKKIARSVALLEFSFIPPMVGNLIIIVPLDKNISLLGCYTQMQKH